MRTALLIAAGVIVLLVVAVVGAGLYQLSRPLPILSTTPQLPTGQRVEGTAPTLPWPSVGSAAVGVEDLGLLGTAGTQSPRPIASIAKVMTALVVLADHPLQLREPGPRVTFTAADVARYEAGLAEGESVVLVEAGAGMTEYQLLQALLLPSGNNIADVLGRWDAGSIPEFVQKMNARASALGMASTHFADTSGYSAQTTSTPGDLVRMGQTAMQDPVLADIVAQTEATLPVAGRVFNVNSVLGREGIVGIKTGSTPEAGGSFLFAGRQAVGSRSLSVVGAVLGRDLLGEAFEDAERLLGTIHGGGLTTTTVLQSGQVVGAYDVPWGEQVAVAPTDDVVLLGWPGMQIQQDIDLQSLAAPAPAGTTVGQVHVKLGDQERTVPLATLAPLPLPDRQWRLTRPL